MSKKIMPLALAVGSAALLALPAMASAQELHFESGTGTQFGGNAKSSTVLKATGEPTITCATYFAEGEFTSETTATLGLDLYECHTVIVGVTQTCRTSGSPLNNTIASSGIGHFITIETINQPGLLITPPFPTIICSTGTSERKIQLTGPGVIGTITAPACNALNGAITLSFKPNGAGTAQEHVKYTGTSYDLELTTETGTDVTGIFEGELTLSLVGKALKLICT